MTRIRNHLSIIPIKRQNRLSKSSVYRALNRGV